MMLLWSRVRVLPCIPPTLTHPSPGSSALCGRGCANTLLLPALIILITPTGVLSRMTPSLGGWPYIQVNGALGHREMSAVKQANRHPSFTLHSARCVSEVEFKVSKDCLQSDLNAEPDSWQRF